MVAGADAVREGEAKNSWLTGTAAWNWYAATQWLLGIRPEYDGIRGEPSLPACFKSFKVHRKFRDAEYDISVNLTGKGGSEFIPYSPGKHTINLTI